MAMWLNYVISDNDAILVNFERDDSIFTNESNSHINFEDLEDKIQREVCAKFPDIDFTFTTIKNQNGLDGFASVKCNTSDIASDDIEEYINQDLLGSLDFYDEFFYECPENHSQNPLENGQYCPYTSEAGIKRVPSGNCDHTQNTSGKCPFL